MSMRTSSRLDALSDIDHHDPLAELEADHRRVELLFARAGLCRGDERRSALRQAADALTTHAELEEQVVYPAIMEALPNAPWLIDNSVDDHDEIRVLIAAIDDAADEVTLLAASRALQILVQAHVAVEEGEIFPAFRQVADDGTMAALADEAAAARTNSNDRTAEEVAR